MDMMRPVSVHVPRALPAAPILTIASGSILNWTDGTPVDYTTPASWTLTGPAVGTAEVGYRIQRAPLLANGTAGVFVYIGTALANQTTFTTTGADGAYRVVAWNAAGQSVSNVLNVTPQILSGRVTAGGTNVAGAVVTAYTLAGVGVKATTTSSSGNYAMVLIPGSYKLYVTSTVVGYSNEWVGGSSFGSAATTVFTVTAVQNIALQASPWLSGVVTAGGANVANATVSAYSLAGVAVASATTNASGAYTFKTLPLGSYKLYVTSPLVTYPSQWVGGTTFGTAATTVLSATLTQNIALVGLPVLTGRVTANGANVAGAFVTAYTLAGVGLVVSTTNASGTYSLALPAGSYKLYVTSPLVGFPSQWVGGATFATAAITVFTVTATQNIVLHP